MLCSEYVLHTFPTEMAGNVMVTCEAETSTTLVIVGVVDAGVFSPATTSLKNVPTMNPVPNISIVPPAGDSDDVTVVNV